MKSTSVLSSQSRSPKAETTTVTFVLLKEDRDELTKISKILGMSVSGICREALKEYVDRLEEFGTLPSTQSIDLNLQVGE